MAEMVNRPQRRGGKGGQDTCQE